MAIDRFENKNILTTSKVPVEHTQVYSKSDTIRMGKTTTSIPSDDLVFAKVEKHVYSGDILLSSTEESLNWIPSTDTETKSTYDILINPEYDVRLADIQKGYYSIVYNFVDTLTDFVDIHRISSDRTEIELSVDGGNSFGDLYSAINPTTPLPYKDELVLNFGENEIIPIIGIDFNNNPRVGETVSDIPYPKSTAENGVTTTFYPITNNDDNFWIEVRDAVLLDSPLQRESFGPMSKRYIKNKTERTATGRAAKFNLIAAGAIPEFMQEHDTNNEPIYYTPGDMEGRDWDGPTDGYRTNQAYKDTAKVRYFNPTLTNTSELQRVVVKLYKPLKDSLHIHRPSIARLVRDSYIERLLVYPFAVAEVTDNFSSPNFKIDMGNYGKSQGTDLKTWNTLLDTNLSTSQQIIDKYVSSSSGGSTLNIDYSNFTNFVNYSSAVERVNNLKYKLELIESYEKRINTLNHTSGSEALTNISQSLNRKSNVISGFDGWEKWMYYESTGSLYTHYSSSAYTMEPWPKYQEYPNINYSVTASQAITHYNGLIDSASIFDAFNDARLTKMIPAAIVEDPQNSDYVLFIDMIGHHYDITWSYINSLTTLNEREEHPYDGMPNEMLYEVASSMGWKLTQSKDRSELWNYGVGTDKFGNYIQSGSLPTKSHEQYNNEIWRRIVNNIPYLLKSKGSARAVKALIATYGIPQTFLSIREYGGPMVDDVRPIWEHDKFVYHLRFDTDNYITAPWGKINDIDPETYNNREPNPIDTLELQFQQNELSRTTSVLHKGDDFAVTLEPSGSKVGRGNIHMYLSGSAGYKSASILDVPIFDRQMSTLLVQREVSVDDITKDNTYKLQYRRNRKDVITISKSASIDIDGSTESSYNAAWTGSGVLNIGKAVPASLIPHWGSANTLSGSIQEIRYWANPLKDIVVDEHTLSRETYHGNSATSSYFDLKFRFIPDSQLKNVIHSYDGIVSQHPNRKITTLEDGITILSASLFNFEPDDLRGVTEEYYTKVPSAGANNIMNNKVRLEASELTGILDPEHKKEKSKYDSAPVDSNQVGVYLSATKMYNEDIYNHTGYFEIDDYIGDPDRRKGYTEQNEDLDHVRRQVFKKYSSRNLINTVIDTLSKYDFSVFEQIRQTMPARVDYNSGILIEPHILERPKEKSQTNLGYTNPQYSTVITPEMPISSVFIQHEAVIPTPYSQSADYILHEGKILPAYSQSAEYINHNANISLIDKAYVINASVHDYTSSISTIPLNAITSNRVDLESMGNPIVRSMYDASVYQYTILTPSASADVGYGIGWNTGSNGYWNYNAIATSVVDSKKSKYGMKPVYFYSTAASASLRLSSSSSLVPSDTSTDELSLASANLRFNGCKMTSDSLTSNSPDTPDGRGVIELFTADPSVLIYTSQTGDKGNLNVDSKTNISTVDLKELYVWKYIVYELRKEYDIEVRAFRRKLAKLIEIENARHDEFLVRIKKEQFRGDKEERRRAEFDIINKPQFTGGVKPLPMSEDILTTEDEMNISIENDKMRDANDRGLNPDDIRTVKRDTFNHSVRNSRRTDGRKENDDSDNHKPLSR